MMTSCPKDEAPFDGRSCLPLFDWPSLVSDAPPLYIAKYMYFLIGEAKITTWIQLSPLLLQGLLEMFFDASGSGTSFVLKKSGLELGVEMEKSSSNSASALWLHRGIDPLSGRLVEEKIMVSKVRARRDFVGHIESTWRRVGSQLRISLRTSLQEECSLLGLLSFELPPKLPEKLLNLLELAVLVSGVILNGWLLYYKWFFCSFWGSTFPRFLDDRWISTTCVPRLSHQISITCLWGICSGDICSCFFVFDQNMLSFFLASWGLPWSSRFSFQIHWKYSQVLSGWWSNRRVAQINETVIVGFRVNLTYLF